ncbi:MAG: hypothetical protein J1F11_05315 [Oscillospiraceae bacterium]|nr:hypothetical protein [Oscillospiraceae bacterium]
MANVEFKKSVINNGITGHIFIDSDNNIVGLNDDFDFDELSELLEAVSIESDIMQERKYAAEAKKYADKHDQKSLKKFISENKSAFTSGTFATVAGGVLLELIKNLVGF